MFWCSTFFVLLFRGDCSVVHSVLWFSVPSCSARCLVFCVRSSGVPSLTFCMVFFVSEFVFEVSMFWRSFVSELSFCMWCVRAWFPYKTREHGRAQRRRDKLAGIEIQGCITGIKDEVGFRSHPLDLFR